VDPVPDPILLRKSGKAGSRTRDLWNCSQKSHGYKYIGLHLGEFGTNLVFSESKKTRRLNV
jgi:hypothetical protein